MINTLQFIRDYIAPNAIFGEIDILKSYINSIPINPNDNYDTYKLNDCLINLRSTVLGFKNDLKLFERDKEKDKEITKLLNENRHLLQFVSKNTIDKIQTPNGKVYTIYSVKQYESIDDFLDNFLETIQHEYDLMKGKQHKTLNYKEFVYLCLELGLVNKDINRENQENEIRTIYKNQYHKIFEKIKLRTPINENTDIISIVKKYYSNDKDENTIKTMKTLIKQLRLNSD